MQRRDFRTFCNYTWIMLSTGRDPWGRSRCWEVARPGWRWRYSRPARGRSSAPSSSSDYESVWSLRHWLRWICSVSLDRNQSPLSDFISINPLLTEALQQLQENKMIFSSPTKLLYFIIILPPLKFIDWQLLMLVPFLQRLRDLLVGAVEGLWRDVEWVDLRQERECLLSINRIRLYRYNTSSFRFFL